MRSAMARPMPREEAGDDGDFSRHIKQGHAFLPNIDPAADAPVFIQLS